MPTSTMHKDYGTENAFFNRLKMAPHSTPGATAIGSLFMAGPGGKKLAASSQDHANAHGFQKRDNSGPGLVLGHFHAAAQHATGPKYGSRVAHGPAKGGFLHDQQ